MEFWDQGMLRNSPVFWDTTRGHRPGEGLEGTVAVSQVGHMVALSPHHSWEIKEGKPWENASSEPPCAPGVRFVGQSRVLRYCEPQQNPSLPPVLAAGAFENRDFPRILGSLSP